MLGAFHTPKGLIQRHYDLFICAVIFFFYGFVHGLTPKYAQPVLEEARKLTFDPYRTSANIISITFNNGMLSVVLWLGWILMFFLGLSFFPITVMIYNIGVPFGAVASNLSIPNFVGVMLSFGILELLGYLFSVVAGLVLIKYVIFKLLRHPVSINEAMVDSFSLFAYGFAFIILGAFFEALVLNPKLSIIGLALGTLCTTLVLHWLWKNITS
ncbi:MAG: stage II sporulation protein M [Candidatus Bathyarchaeota archaeon]|nr:stage II sporulation protein M [Candidatus Bathyarchaeota archaeon]MDW8022357.1 stage II sporulation protein M [Nitrososphaerota archaeon]